MADFNNPPTLTNPIPELNIVIGQEFSLTLARNTFTDPDPGDELTYSVTLADDSPLPSGISFDQTTRTLQGQLGDGTIELDGLKLFKAAVEDRSGNKTTAQISVDAHGGGSYASQKASTNHPFSFQTPDYENPSIPTTFTANLKNGNPLPAWLTFDQGSHTFSGTPRKTDVGELEISVKQTSNPTGDPNIDHKVINGHTFKLTVVNVNNPPTVVNLIPAQGTIIDRPFGYIVPDNTFTDFDGGTPTYSVTLADGSPLPGWLIFNPATRTFSGTPSIANYGLINVSVKATDSAQESNSSTFVLNVDIDAAQYGASYNDLIGSYGYNLAGLSEHYRTVGRTEGRNPDTFDEYRYLAGYDDLLNIYKTDVVGATAHYITQGAKTSKGAEGRDPLAFKSNIYLASHKDLLDAVKPIADYSKKLEFASSHYVLHGRGEGRAKEIFNPAAYLAAHPDIAPIYGSDPAAHYILHGYAEGRTI